MKTILITGASGVVGRGVHQTITVSGRRILTVGRSDVAEIHLDLTRQGLDLPSQVRCRPDIVLHFAAVVPNSDGIDDTEANATLTKRLDANILNAAREWQCPVIYASGCNLYTRNVSDYLTEANELGGYFSSPYLQAKLDGDVAYGAYSMGIVLRISAPIGRGLPKTTALGLFLEAAHNGKAIEVWGSGAREQDYIDVRDIGFLVDRIIEAPAPGTYNVAHGNPTTMMELAQTVSQLVPGTRVLLGKREDRKEGVTARFCIDKSKSTFQWLPRASLDDSLRWILDGER